MAIFDQLPILHFSAWQTCPLRHQLDFSGKYSAKLQLMREDYSLTFSPLSVARYSFIQLGQLERHGQRENAHASKQQQRVFEPRLSWLRVRHSTTELRAPPIYSIILGGCPFNGPLSVMKCPTCESPRRHAASPIKGALYRIQILCRRYTFWSYPAG